MEKIIKEEQEPLNVTTEQQKEGRAPKCDVCLSGTTIKNVFYNFIIKIKQK